MVHAEDVVRQIVIYCFGYLIVEIIDELQFRFHKYQDKKASKEFYRKLEDYLEYRKPEETNKELKEYLKSRTPY